MPMPRKARQKCPACGNETPTPRHRYCNNRCQHDYQHNVYIERWKRGDASGLRSKGVVTGQIKRFLREKYGNRCCECGWSRQHPVTGVVPLTAHHIDGNWQNNREENLQLLCANCHSLTPNYCGHNHGNGRKREQTETRRFVEASELLERERVGLSEARKSARSTGEAVDRWR